MESHITEKNASTTSAMEDKFQRPGHSSAESGGVGGGGGTTKDHLRRVALGKGKRGLHILEKGSRERRNAKEVPTTHLG